MKDDEEKMKVIKRKSNFELLRIISMLGIVLFHFFYHGNYDTSSMNFNSSLIVYLQFVGEVGVDIFVIISGYFIVNRKTIWGGTE